ncbi:FAD/NAD(P)-binding domain-containing protein [Marasmius fiardii PR-910]|nr:FAD/NAD(P)-binding domain-containing protein [Marasmius fiardii PR-910]
MQAIQQVEAQPYPPSLYEGRVAHERLKILIVGGGLGGLAAAHCLGQAGHQVMVFESATSVSEIGAGIQICPNLSRLLIRWGLRSELERLLRKDTPTSWSFYRYADGKQVGLDPLGRRIEYEHGVPWYVSHRADLHALLFSIAKPFMELRLGTRVIVVDPDRSSITLHTGEMIRGDFIIGADGIHSIVRGCVVGENNTPLSVSTGDMAYRALIPTDTFMEDPDLRDLVENPRVNCWMGPLKHIIGYNVRGKRVYNLVMIGPDDDSTYSWTAKGNIADLRKSFTGWEPRIQKLIDRIDPDAILKTKLMICAPLAQWTHSKGHVTLIGDACHPMLPCRAQGAAMAIEDAAVLGNLFSRLHSRSEIPDLLHAYQEIRYKRATSFQEGSLSNRHLFHMLDGPEQEARDAAMTSVMAEIDEHNANSTITSPWSNKSKNVEHFGYDADRVTEEWWKIHGIRIRRATRL